LSAHEVADALIASTRALLDELRAPAIAPFLAAWPVTAARRTVHAAAFPVLRCLPDAVAGAPPFSAALARELHRAAPSLAWQQSYRRDEVASSFLDNYAWSELVGLRGPLASVRIACGFLLLGPSTLYPRHHHEAEEVYLPLAGTAAWQRGDGPWTPHAPGAVIAHASDEMHAMRTDEGPLLALYLWRSADLAQPTRLDRTPPDAMPP
jgi:hypothetical protein